jgi:exosortase A
VGPDEAESGNPPKSLSSVRTAAQPHHAIHLTLATIAVAILLVLFHRTAYSIVRLWLDNSAYSHGFLVIPLAAWLVWERRQTLDAVSPRPVAWALLPLFLAAIVWLTAQIISIQVVSQLALVAMVNCVLLALLGPATYRILLLPALFLFAAVPVGEELTPQLQSWTANIAVAALRASGQPVFQEGLQISTPIGSFAVADECSGLRFLTATLTLAILFAAQFYSSWTRRFAFMALALIIPIIANGLRAYTVILLAGRFGLEFAASVDHVVYGWVFLSLVTGLLLIIGWSFRQPPVRVRIPSRGAPRRQPLQRRDALVASGVLTILIAVSLTAAALAGEHHAIVKLDLPSQTAPLDAATVQNLPWRPDLPGADARRFDQELVDGHAVTRVVAYYAWQRQGAKATDGGASLAPADWTRLSFGKAAVTVDGQAFTAQRLVAAKGNQRWLIYTWYWVPDRFTGSPTVAKLLQIKGLLQGRNAAATIVVATPFAVDEDAATVERTLSLVLGQQQGLSGALANVGGIQKGRS